MVSPPTRVISLVIVIALSGSPAVLSACMALCLQDVATAASTTDRRSEGHETHASAALPADSSAHAHHGSPAPDDSAATATATASPQDASDTRMGTPPNCCPDEQAKGLAGRGMERTDAKSFSATQIASPVASFLSRPLGLGAPAPSPPAPPPSTRAPLVLRI